MKVKIVKTGPCDVCGKPLECHPWTAGIPVCPGIYAAPVVRSTEDDEIARLKALLDEAERVMEAFVEEQRDYMTRNNLGNPDKQHTIKQGAVFLAKLRKEQPNGND